MNLLVERLPSKIDEPSQPPTITQVSTRETSFEADVAPVFLIRDAASQSGATPNTTINQHPATWSDASVGPAEIDQLLLVLVFVYGILRSLTLSGSMSTTADGCDSMSMHHLSN